MYFLFCGVCRHTVRWIFFIKVRFSHLKRMHPLGPLPQKVMGHILKSWDNDPGPPLIWRPVFWQISWGMTFSSISVYMVTHLTFGPKLDPCPVPYFRVILLLPLIQEVLLSFTSKSMCMEYYIHLVKLAQDKSGYVTWLSWHHHSSWFISNQNHHLKPDQDPVISTQF